MQALLEEFISSHSFYNADCGDLCSQAQLAATSVADGHLREVLSRAAEYLAFGDVRAALVDLLYAQRLAPSHSLITLLIGDTRLHLGIAEAAQPFELLARRSSWSGAWYRLVLAHFRNRNYDLASLELHEALSLNAPLLDADSVQLMADVTRGSEAAGWCGLNNRGQLLMGGAAATAAGVQVTVEIDGVPRTLGRRRTIRRHTLCSFDLGAEVLRGSLLRVRVNSTPLLGSPIQIGSVTRMEGFVDRHDGTVTGWCWLPGEPSVRPEVTVAKPADQAPMLRCQAADLVDTTDNLQNLRWQRTFAFSTASLPEGMLLVRDGRGRSLYGSPLNPGGSWTSGMIAAAKLARRFPVMGEPELTDSDEASEISIPALHKGRRLPVSGTEEIRRGVLVAIPVYRGYETTMRCLESVMLHRGNERIFVVSDASPDPRIFKALNRLAAHGAIELRQETINRGFPGTANLALREAASAGLDIVLLNSDTIVSAGWVERLGDAAYSAPNIGTATPFSNSATILSYPDRGALNAVPDVAQANALAAQFFEANGSATVEIPTGHGFCLYIKHACLSETGSLREDVFAQGYGEENDFCLRARHLGWRHVAAAGVYVAHVEGQSFAPAKTSLVQRNLRNLNLLHPGYDGLIADWAGRDPLMECRRRVDWLRLAAIQGTRAAICFVTHAREGGVLRQVEARARAAEKDGFASFILSPRKGSQGQRYCDIRMPGCAFPNLRFSVDRDLDLFKSFLQQRALAHIELHHFIGHDERLIQMMSRLEVPFDIYLHDYSWFCPRITLTYDNRYCGEPAVKVCEACVQDKGSSIEWEVSPRDLILWSQDLFTRARVVVAPTTDTAIRFERRFGIMPKVVAWEMERRPVQLRPIPTIGQGRVRKICVAGAIGYEKGYEVILGCARYAAAHDLPVEFQIVGFTCDDARLIATRKVTVTGRYDESEAVSLIRQQESDFGFLPALWPETWSFVLSQLWEAGLPVVAFDIGAQSERIRSSGAGLVLPMNLPVDKLVHSLCRVSS